MVCMWNHTGGPAATGNEDAVHCTQMPKRFSIIFCGTPEFALPSLEALAADHRFDVQLVITQPDKPVGRKKIITPPPVKVAAEHLGIPVWQPKNINDSARSPQLAAHSFDFLVVVAYGKILSKELLSLPRIAPVNVHASLLPRWRGASPIEHAILAGDSETGVTVQIMAPKLDAGDILAQERTAIGPRETTTELKERLSQMGTRLLVHTLKAPLRPVPQPVSGVTLCRTLRREDSIVEPLTMTAQELDRRVRAFNPWPGVTCTVAGRQIKLLETSLEPVPGVIELPCAQNTTLSLVSVQEPGKKVMKADAWKRGIIGLFFLALPLALSVAHAQSPDIKDTDGDAIIDTIEDTNRNGIVDSGETNPMNADTDDGGEADGQEIHGGRNPFLKEDDLTWDRDSDGLTNGKELIAGTDAKNPDTDGDGALDGTDPFPLERAYKRDANKNGLPDEWEEQHQLTSPSSQSSSASSTAVSSSIGTSGSTAAGGQHATGGGGGASPSNIPDRDDDGDGLTNRQEFERGTDPRSADTDRDGTADGKEITEGSEPTESACLAWDPSIEPLPDIRGHWAQEIVTTLQHVLVLPARDPIIRGYILEASGGTLQHAFLPDRPVSRFEFLKMALLSSCIDLPGASEALTPFPDVPARRPHENMERGFRRRVIAAAVQHEIVHGYPDGFFRPDHPVTRAEALKMLLRATRLVPLPEEIEPISFTDVPSDAWFRTYVEQAFAMRLIEGYGDGTFRPHNSITRAEAAKIIDYALLTNPGVNGYVIPAE